MTSQGKGLSLQEGQKVLHPTLGDGVVLSVSVTGQPARQVALIDFECGPTKVIPSLVELTILSDAPTGRDTGWEDPLPFDWPTKLPGWPSGVFPPVVASFAAALAEDTQTPLDFVTDEPTQSSQYDGKDDILLNYVLAYFFKALGRADRAQYFESLAKEQLDEAIERDDLRPDMEVSRDVDGTGLYDGTNGAYWAQPFVKSAP